MTVRLPTWCPECGSAAPTVRYNRPCENVYHDVVVNVDRRVVTGLRRAYVARRGYWVEHSRRTGMGRRKTDSRRTGLERRKTNG